MSTARHRSAPGERVRGAQDRRDAVAELSERAAAQAGTLVTGEDWASWLRLAARFPGWSFTNVMLIAAQRPGAIAVAGYQAWQDQGRQVRKGEPGIQVLPEPRLSSRRRGIFVPSARTEAAGPIADGAGQARLTYVWDITQTSGPAGDGRPMLTTSAGGMPPGLWDALTWLARREGFAVGRGDCGSGHGVTSWASRRIRIRPGLDRREEAHALLHELGHVLAHGRLAAVPGASTAGCRGIGKVEADSIAFIISARLGIGDAARSWPFVASWAGSDARARPLDTICATGARITTAATTITGHLDTVLFATLPQDPAADLAHAVGATTGAAAGGEPAAPAQTPAGAVDVRSGTGSAPVRRMPGADISRVLLDAEQFYLARLDGSWVPGYLEARGFSQATMRQWRVGYAPTGWTALLGHLRTLGHDDGAIEAAGLARRSARGALIDHFRDRVILPIRDEHGAIAGFIGRAHPDAGPAVPKYLNSPQTAAYTKGDLLFGLHEARGPLARGAMPVIAEGPLDAIAISTASPGRYAGLAPCGTALTSRQAAALGRLADPGKTGVLVALDGDRAGREAAIKAYRILFPVAATTTAVILPSGQDPAGILQTGGPAALSNVLQHQIQPLARVVIDAHLDAWGRQLDDAAGQLRAMRSAATLIAGQLPPETADRVLQITGGGIVATLDQNLRPVADARLPEIARLLPADVICQIIHTADRLASECSDVTAEVANAVARRTADPDRVKAIGVLNCAGKTPVGGADTSPARLTSVGFPSVSSSTTSSAGPAALLLELPVPYRRRPHSPTR